MIDVRLVLDCRPATALRQEPRRILHVVGGMDRGGTETWLMHVLRAIDRSRYRMDFLVHTADACAYDEEVVASQSRIVRCPGHTRPHRYLRTLRRLLREHGPFDIVHSHVHHFSGLVLAAARQAGVPVRIAHSHSDTSELQQKAGWLRRCYLRLMDRCIFRNATYGLAASRQAAAALFGPHWETRSQVQVLHCGVDLAPFRESGSRSQVRAVCGLPPDSFVVGHVGSFGPPKNHEFLVDIAGQLVSRLPRMRFLLVGDGPRRPAIERQVAQAGLSDAFVFAGMRSDVPRLLGALDAFLFPSRWEGLPLSLIEAQAAGLPCFVSDVITSEACVIKPLVTSLSLQQPATVWAEAILAAHRAPPRVTRTEALALVEGCSFNIDSSLRNLESVYDGR